MLGNRIAAIRKSKGISQAQLAQELNISSSAVGMYEQNRRIPPLDSLIAMSRIFETSLDYLITGTEYSSAGMQAIKRDSCPCTTCCWQSYKE